MSGYAGDGLSKLIQMNEQRSLWANEKVVAGELSLAFQLSRITSTYYPWGTSFEVIFGGNPGAFEIDIMGANTDQRVSYISIGSITDVSGSTVAGAYVGRWDMPSNVWPRFVAAYMKTLTNAVTVTLGVTR
jgi:hypothetical protein